MCIFFAVSGVNKLLSWQIKRDCPKKINQKKQYSVLYWLKSNWKTFYVFMFSWRMSLFVHLLRTSVVDVIIDLIVFVTFTHQSYASKAIWGSVCCSRTCTDCNGVCSFDQRPKHSTSWAMATPDSHNLNMLNLFSLGFSTTVMKRPINIILQILGFINIKSHSVATQNHCHSTDMSVWKDRNSWIFNQSLKYCKNLVPHADYIMPASLRNSEIDCYGWQSAIFLLNLTKNDNNGWIGISDWILEQSLCMQTRNLTPVELRIPRSKYAKLNKRKINRLEIEVTVHCNVGDDNEMNKI